MPVLYCFDKWNSLRHVRLFATSWTIRPWNSPGQNTWVGSCSLLWGIFSIQESSPGICISGRFFISGVTRETWLFNPAYLTYMQSTLHICTLHIIMWNARLDEAQAGIKIAGRNINNLRYADDTKLMAEREEELKSLLMKVKESGKSWLKTQHSKNEDHGIWSCHVMVSWWGNNGNSDRLYFLELQNHCR